MKNSELPNFFLAGHPKCGTTTLYEYLAAHPAVFVPAVKEPAYFSNQDEYERGLCHYSALHYKNADTSRPVGDATPWYAPIPRALKRIRDDLPPSSHRFIVILREPAERAYSMYWDQVRVGRETRDFDVATREQLGVGEADPPQNQHECRTRYIWTSRYDRHMQLMDDMFGRDATLVLIQDDLGDDHRRTLLLQKLATFLGVDSKGFSQEERRANVAKGHHSPRLAKALSSPGPIARAVQHLARATVPLPWRRRVANRLIRINKRPHPYPPINPRQRERLDEYFATTTRFVERRVGRELAAWRTTPEEVG